MAKCTLNLGSWPTDKTERTRAIQIYCGTTY